MASSYIKNLTFSYNFFPVARKLTTPLLKIKNALTVSYNSISDSAKKLPTFNLSKFIYICLLLLAVVRSVNGATTYTWTGNTSNAWATTTNWNPNGNPGSATGDIVNIPAVANQPLLTIAPDNSLASLTFTGATATLNITGVTLTITGAVTLNNAAAANTAATITGTGTLNCGSLNIGNNTLPASTANTTLTSGISNFSCTNNIVIKGISYGNGSNARHNNGAITITSGTVTVNGSVSSSFSISGNGIHPTATITMGSSNPSLILAGMTPFNFSNSGTNTILLNGTGATVNYAYSGSQTVYATDYNNLTFSNSGTKTLQTGTTIAGNLSLTGAVSSTLVENLSIGGNLNIGFGSTLDLNTFNASRSSTGGSLIVTGSMLLAGTSNFPTNYSTSTLTAGTVNYDGNGIQTVSVQNYGNLTLSGTNAKSTTSSSTVVGVLSIEGTASINGTVPTWSGTAYTLQYKTTDTHTAGAEWISPFVGTGGIIVANTAGSVSMNSDEVLNVSVPLTIAIGATLNTANFNLTLGDDFNNNGTFMAGTGTVTLNGNAPQIIGGTATTTFSNLTVANTGGNGNNTITLGAPSSVSGVLTLISGLITTTSTYLLSITNSATSAISGGSATSFINGPVKWTLPPTYSTVSTYVFPVGNTSYLPFALVNPVTGTGTVTAQVQATNGNSHGIPDTSLDSISHTEYWSLATVGNFTSCSVSLTRQNAIMPVLDAVAGSSNTLDGNYSALAGTVSTYGISNSNTIGDNRFFVFAKGKPFITTNTTSLTGFTYPVGHGPSSAQSFTVKGNYLSTNITVLPTDSFEISLTTGTSFAPQSKITLQVLNGTVALDTVYVRMKAGLAISPKAVNYIQCSSDNATTIQVSCSGTVTTAPTITVTPTTLSGFYYNVSSGGPSVEQSFIVTGVNLTSDILITAPTDYLICLARRGTYGSTILLTQSGGNVTDSVYVRLKAGLSVSIYNENIVLSTSTITSPVTQNVTLNGSVNSPMIKVSTFTLGGFIYSEGSGPSGVQTFTVSGTNLTGNLRLKAPVNFQISLDNSTYKSSPDSLIITPTSGTINSTIIYVRLASGLTGVGSPRYGPGNLTAVSTGAITQNVLCSGQVVPTSTPTSIASNNTLVGFVYTFGHGPSVVQSFTVSGTALSAGITVTPSSNFEIKLHASDNWSSTALTITQSGGLVNADSVYVQLKAALAVGTYSGGNINLSSSGATDVNVTCNGIVITAPTITAVLSGSTCSGSTITLTSNGTGIMNQYWSGPNGFYSTAADTSIVNIASAHNGIYTVTGNALSDVNLLTNGNFESGNTGFGSSYNYVSPGTNVLWPEGNYTVDATPRNDHDNFCTCPDYDNPHNNQLIVNGAISTGIIAWSESVSVVPGANYQFSYFVQTVSNDGHPAQLQLYVNGVPAGIVYIATATESGWQQFVYNTNSGSNTVLQLTLINLNIIAGGNDFALDNMVFQQIFSVSASDTLTVNQNLVVSASITASIDPLYSGGSVTFTATPVNGGTSPSYQWIVNGVNVGTNSSLYTYTPATGDSIRCKVTSNYPCITGSNPATSNKLTAIARSNFWVGTSSTNWGTSANWSGGFIPAPGNDVEYATNANNNNHPALRDLHLDQDRTVGNLVNITGKKLIIPADKQLIVNNTISTNNADSIIYIFSSTTGPNGSLIFHNSVSSPVHATVEMYTQAWFNLADTVNNRYHWQYFGIPILSVRADPTFYQSYVRRWNEAGDSITNHWEQLGNLSMLTSFTGYEICQQGPKTITFTGQLENRDFSSGRLTVTPTALYPGQHIFANPYTAAIDIRQLTFGTQTEASVYLYNTGTYNDWLPSGQSSPGTSPGQYTVATKFTAGNLDIPRQIPSMQGFLVKAMSDSPTATFGINYNSVVMKNIDAQRAPGVKNLSETDQVSTRIDVAGTNYSDKMWLFTNPDCRRNFDNGWDGAKIQGSVLTPQIFAVEPDGNYQVNAVDDINNTLLGFQAGEDVEYTLTFTHQSIKTRYAGIYLVDLVENKTVDITENGSTYSFVAVSTPTPVNRFKIATRNYEKDAPDALTQLKVFGSGNTIFVQNLSNLNGELILVDMMGHLLKRTAFGPYGITAVQAGLIPGSYVVNASTSIERVSKRIITGK